MFVAELHVIPLAERVAVRRIDRPVDQRQEVGQRIAAREMRHGQIDDATAPIRMVRRHCPADRTAKAVTDPDGRPSAERIVQLGHVGDHLADRIIGDVIGDRRAAIPPQVGRDAPPSRRRKMGELRPPGQTQMRPAVQEGHQRATGGTDLNIGRAMSRRRELPVGLGSDVRSSRGNHARGRDCRPTGGGCARRAEQEGSPPHFARCRSKKRAISVKTCFVIGALAAEVNWACDNPFVDFQVCLDASVAKLAVSADGVGQKQVARAGP